MKKQFFLANKKQDYAVLNFEHYTPEFNRKNNWKSVNKLTLNGDPLKIRFVRDVKNQNYNQLNVM